MGGDVVDRLRGGGLAALAVLVVAAGGGWWRAQAPTVGPSGGSAAASPGPGDGSDVTGGSERIGSGRPAADGRRRATTRMAVIDGATGKVIAEGVLDTRHDENLGGGSDRTSPTVWRARLTVRPGLPPQRRVLRPARAWPHLLEYRCVGQGQLLLVSVHSGRPESRNAPCDGTAAAMFLNVGDGPIRIEFAATPGGGPAVVDARLAALRF
ncbi:hypothetical protein [Micromonospora sp. RTGN7]|uniref:hypothetical protein n=1 Tax=Micromonospora sp. RTGN7 TaxID=3016526 RepID=UPI0029FF280A|nr:hypothetical protein [Micromonospora sp. RTGN7]